MIWHKKEGDGCRRGVNLMWGVGFGVILFLAGYKWRIQLGFYINRMYKLKLMFDRWDLERDFKSHVFMRNLHTTEEMMDHSDKKLEEYKNRPPQWSKESPKDAKLRKWIKEECK